MKAEEVREHVWRAVCSMPDEILYGHDPRIKEYGDAADPMKRVIRRNPPYLKVLDAAYNGDRTRFGSDLERSLAIVGEEDINQERVEALAGDLGTVKRALDACAYNEFALHCFVAHYSNRNQQEFDNLLALMDYATRALCLNPRNPFVRLSAGSTANVLGWHREAVRLVDPFRTDSMVGMGQPIINYLGVREHTEGFVLMLENHFRENRAGLPPEDGPMNPLMNLNASIVSFGICASHTASSDHDQLLDQTRKDLYTTAYEALKQWAVRTARIDAAEAERR